MDFEVQEPGFMRSLLIPSEIWDSASHMQIRMFGCEMPEMSTSM